MDMTNGVCPNCGRNIGMNAGRLARHNYPYNRGKRCHGSGGASRERLTELARHTTADARALSRRLFR